MSESSPIRIGNKVFIRTVTYFYTGRIFEVTDSEIILEEAAWIASTGRFHQAMKSGLLEEVEPYPQCVKVSVQKGAIVDCSDWIHPLPSEAK